MNAPPPAQSADRRIAPRFQPAFGTVCRIAHGGHATPIVGLVWNISETGVSMLVGDPPKAGTELTAELKPEAGGPGLAVTLRVMHVRPIETGDFFLGAQFTRPLKPDEMRPFLAARLQSGGNGSTPEPPKKK